MVAMVSSKMVIYCFDANCPQNRVFGHVVRLFRMYDTHLGRLAIGRTSGLNLSPCRSPYYLSEGHYFLRMWVGWLLGRLLKPLLRVRTC